MSGTYNFDASSARGMQHASERELSEFDGNRWNIWLNGAEYTVVGNRCT